MTKLNDDVTEIDGIGEGRATEMAEEHGVETVGDLANADPEAVGARWVEAARAYLGEGEPGADTPEPADEAPQETTDPRDDPRVGRESSDYFPGIAQRDVELVRRVADDLGAVADALESGDVDAVREVYPRFLKLPREAERIRMVARRAMRWGH